MGQQILRHDTILLPTPAGTTLAYSSPGRTSTDNFSAAPRLDISNIQSAVQLYFKQGLATTTQKSHQTGQKRYLTFCSELMKPPLATTEDILLMFVSYLAQQGLTHAFTSQRFVICTSRQAYTNNSPSSFRHVWSLC